LGSLFARIQNAKLWRLKLNHTRDMKALDQFKKLQRLIFLRHAISHQHARQIVAVIFNAVKHKLRVGARQALRRIGLGCRNFQQ
jgi:hypothetical protein